MFYIRADGNTHIGMGHVMRCLSIADAAYELDKENKAVFIVADMDCQKMICDRGYEVKVLNTDYMDMESEIAILKTFIKKTDVILVDSYQVTNNYYLELRNISRVACLEDMGNSYPVDLLVNYNIYGPNLKNRYSNNGIGDASFIGPDRYILGLDYMPLRKEFSVKNGYEIKEDVASVMITTGGSDPYFATDDFLQAILSDMDLNNENIVYHVVSGPFNAFADSLKEKYGSIPNVVIHENVKDMKGLIIESDIVITATGSTIYEVSALGVPMICFYFAENQRQGAEEIEKLTDIVNAGCLAENKENVVENIVYALKKCIKSKAYRDKIHMQEMKLVDGKGARRLANEILGLMKGVI